MRKRYVHDVTCKVGDIANCQCNQVDISVETKEYLAKTNYDCLCKKCLEQVNRLQKVSKAHAFPTCKELLIEGLHYTREGNSIVFTELYHVLRGHCCKNGCRNCAYGFGMIKETGDKSGVQ